MRSSTYAGYEEIVNAVESWLLRHSTESNVSLDAFAGELGYSRRSVQRALAHWDETWRELVITFRMEAGARLLKSNRLMTVGEIAAQVGYSSSAQFARTFRERYGVSPIEYRKEPALVGGGNE